MDGNSVILAQMEQAIQSIGPNHDGFNKPVNKWAELVMKCGGDRRIAYSHLRKITKALDYGQIMVARLQSEYSLAFRQSPGNFIMDQWFPIVEAKFPAGKYPKWSLETFFTDPGAAAANWRPGTMPAIIAPKMDDHGDFTTIRHAMQTNLAMDIPYVADPGVDPQAATTYMLTDVMQLHKERIGASKLFKNSVWDTNWTGVTSGESSTKFIKFDDYDNSDPRGVFRDIKMAIKNKCGLTPNLAVMSEPVFEYLRVHPFQLQWYQATNQGITTIQELTEEKLAAALGVNKVLVARGMYNTKAPGAEPSLDWIFGPHIWVGFVDTPGQFKAFSGMTMSYNKPLGGYDTAFSTVPDLITKATWNQAFQCFDHVITAVKAGAMLLDAVTAPAWGA